MKQKPIKKTPSKRTTTRRRKKPLTGFDRFRLALRRRIKLLFVPHKSNQYRPHAIRRYGLTAVLLMVIGLQFGYNFISTGKVLGQREEISTLALLADTNARRVDAGLRPLQMDDKLTRAAQLKVQDMFDKQYWAHDAPDGTTPWYWFEHTGYTYAYAGENLAKNFSTADATTVAWMASPDHRANILDSHYTQAGFAVAEGVLHGKTTAVIVALYGEPAAVATPAVAGVHNAALVVDAPAPHRISPLARLGVAVQSVSPATIGAALIMLFVTGVAVLAHTYRKRLPITLRRSWYRHHGAIKAGGMLSLSFVMLFIYGGGGQI